MGKRRGEEGKSRVDTMSRSLFGGEEEAKGKQRERGNERLQKAQSKRKRTDFVENENESEREER